MPQGTPTFFTIAPDGTVSAEFSGHVTAQGLDIQADPVGLIGATNRVRWLRNALEAAFIGAAEINFGFFRQLSSWVWGAGPAFAALSLTADLTTDKTVVIAQARNSVSPGLSKVILNSDEQSEFLQLTAASRQRVAFGIHNFTVGMGGANRATLNIPHGLPFTPTWAMVNPSMINAAGTSTVQNETVTFAITGITATNIVTLAQLESGATAAVGPSPAYWMAVG